MQIYSKLFQKHATKTINASKKKLYRNSMNAQSQQTRVGTGNEWIDIWFKLLVWTLNVSSKWRFLSINFANLILLLAQIQTYYSDILHVGWRTWTLLVRVYRTRANKQIRLTVLYLPREDITLERLCSPRANSHHQSWKSDFAALGWGNWLGIKLIFEFAWIGTVYCVIYFETAWMFRVPHETLIHLNVGTWEYPVK